MLKTATSESQLPLTHHCSPPSSTWHVIPENFPQVVATERWADGPACCSCGRTPVSATLCGGAGNTERMRKNPTPSFEGRSCISEPVRSQPQLSGVPDNWRRNPRRRAGRRSSEQTSGQSRKTYAEIKHKFILSSSLSARHTGVNGSNRIETDGTHVERSSQIRAESWKTDMIGQVTRGAEDRSILSGGTDFLSGRSAKG
jgi:hypothetical protein